MENHRIGFRSPLARSATMRASVGVISASTLAIGILTALGPIFIALALMPATRGLFVGWVRAMLAAALTPMVGWLLLVLMLTVIEPWIATLAQQRVALALEPENIDFKLGCVKCAVATANYDHALALLDELLRQVPEREGPNRRHG